MNATPTSPASATEAPDLIAAIDRCLPQTQCTQCDYPSCIDYARAVAAGDAEINQCPPGGAVSIAAMAALLGRAAMPLNRAHGEPKPLRVALVEEADCIGCTLCIAACPVDCIVGATKWMHTVIADECTGCALCQPVCPTDCIAMVAPPPRAHGDASAWPQFRQALVDKARWRARNKREREAARAMTRARRKLERRRDALQREIRAAVARKRAEVASRWQE